MFENKDDRKVLKLSSITRSKSYNAMIDGKNFFDQPLKSNMKTYDNIRIIATSQEDDYTTGCSLDYNYFKKCYKLVVID